MIISNASTPVLVRNPSRHPRRALSGDRNQCPGCGEFFNSTHSFEAHRTGTHEGNRRRCLNAAEMSRKGMAHNVAGYWVAKPRTDKDAPRRVTATA